MYERYERLYRRILLPANLAQAYRAVTLNPVTGPDGISADQLGPWLKVHQQELFLSIKDGSWKPSPVRRSRHTLMVPTLPDRFVQQAILQVLLPIFDRDLSPFTLGLRPERGRLHEETIARRFREEGRLVTLSPFIFQCADKIDHQILLKQLGKRIKDEQLLALISHILSNTLITGDGQSVPLTSGIRQSGNLFHLLGTLYLSPCDRALEKQGRRFTRSGDKYRLYLRTRAEAEEALEELAASLETKLRLQLNRERTVIGGE
jgi:RNA-directed DNA polymerase